tara:strand:- start:39674 stop:39862 length:189 start_codon:yes stop_codon:yes gene_type:complete
MEFIMVPTLLEVTPNSSMVSPVPGALSEDIVGEKVVMRMTQVMSIHFLPQVQFLNKYKPFGV